VRKMANIEEIVNEYKAQPLKQDEYTDKILEALGEGDKFRFIISLRLPNYQRPKYDPVQFESQHMYQKWAAEKRRAFVLGHVLRFYDDVQHMGVQLPEDRTGLGILALNMDKKQYAAVKKHELVARIVADNAAWDRSLQNFL